MNKTSRTDEPLEGDGFNQNPNELSNDLVTNQDLNGIANHREQRGRDAKSTIGSGQIAAEEPPTAVEEEDGPAVQNRQGPTDPHRDAAAGQPPADRWAPPPPNLDGAAPGNGPAAVAGNLRGPKSWLERLRNVIVTFGKFIGPGFMVSVAYIDPGNYATGITAGASYRFRLLFVILVSNLIAIFLQNLSIKLGTVTGLNLAEACRAFLPRWLNYFLYFMAEAAIIATDIAEVIGTAIALNLLIPQLPLVAGCALSILDVMIILVFYRPQGSMRGLRAFESFVMLLVLAVVVCFCIQLSLIENASPGEVFKGYLPNDSVTESQGLLQACGILGATVMPHSLYLGSGIVQSRLRDYDAKRGLLPTEGDPSAASALEEDDGKSGTKTYYVPSLAAIKHSLKYSYAETAISLFTFALFVNSAILIVAGASLYRNADASAAADDGDIFGIHALLRASLGPAAATVFALALLFSGVSAGIVCTIAGQMVCEGALRWRVRPWLRRLATRSISVLPSIAIAAGAQGRGRLNAALNGSQVALSVVLPFVSAPLIYFTCAKHHMRVQPGTARFVVEGADDGYGGGEKRRRHRVTVNDVERTGDDTATAQLRGAGPAICMANKWWTAAFGVAVWLLIVVMNVANIVLLGLGK
ncbi:hypothetical protein DL766_005040 [Monosporascus sp. MC13-8B]|uniref:Manganese transporter n=1 Tax=Monosporascus cannonballus TaxID=155416 RepID=A0ABY0GXA6_9PEZI|nr:hypothetical protein DL762_009502 [Monosporascus cannonballus]RYO85173.1 hypothetical protein DL763_007196 [Monosporascus cannonballus]RYP30104.1 hypothetical protein DL766_005040 [Monosporascus sp. MC13-8B]